MRISGELEGPKTRSVRASAMAFQAAGKFSYPNELRMFQCYLRRCADSHMLWVGCTRPRGDTVSIEELMNLIASTQHSHLTSGPQKLAYSAPVRRRTATIVASPLVHHRPDRHSRHQALPRSSANAMHNSENNNHELAFSLTSMCVGSSKMGPKLSW